MEAALEPGKKTFAFDFSISYWFGINLWLERSSKNRID